MAGKKHWQNITWTSAYAERASINSLWASYRCNLQTTLRTMLLLRTCYLADRRTQTRGNHNTCWFASVQTAQVKNEVYRLVVIKITCLFSVLSNLSVECIRRSQLLALTYRDAKVCFPVPDRVMWSFMILRFNIARSIFRYTGYTASLIFNFVRHLVL